ncbi:snaclec B9-like [Haliotis rufescens]|uniref:snaclec B9-like n=1 Tax=Haliotis rufescens TaxID=6454 RepID=UPI00201F7504|nr:snaclec B9-like [Haliotis rufescens]
MNPIPLLVLFVSTFVIENLTMTYSRKPFGPKMCDQFCRQVKQCTAVSFSAEQLSCQLLLKRVEKTEKKNNTIISNQNMVMRGSPEGSEQTNLKLHMGQKTWADAMKACREDGMSLLQMDTRQKQLAVILHPRYNDFNLYKMWLGLTDLYHNDSYYWTSGAPITYAGWAYGEPTHGSQDCVYVAMNSMKWTDSNCESKRRFICEK